MPTNLPEYSSVVPLIARCPGRRRLSGHLEIINLCTEEKERYEDGFGSHDIIGTLLLSGNELTDGFGGAGVLSGMNWVRILSAKLES